MFPSTSSATRLLKAAGDSAEARSRLTLARDLHDSVVQFLAGAAFRLEAMKRSELRAGRFEPELDELKQLMLQEQRELRVVHHCACASGSLVALNDLARDLQPLADRLSRQWDDQCSFSPTAGRDDDPHPAASRRASAYARSRGQCRSSCRGQVDADRADRGRRIELRLILSMTAQPFQPTASSSNMPQSLRERVEQAGGVLDMARGMGVTKLSIALPDRRGRCR